MGLVSSEPRGELERLAYDLSLRTLGQQEAVLDELRSRTGILLTAIALVTSFLGARALQGGASPWFGLTGLGAAVISILVSIYVLAPKSRLTFLIDAPAVFEYFARAESDLAEAHRTLAYWNQETWRGNQAVIDRLVSLFTKACGFLVLSVILWSLGLALD
jgi:hypothetical protein